jgi:hypothetical protein
MNRIINRSKYRIITMMGVVNRSINRGASGVKNSFMREENN